MNNPAKKIIENIKENIRWYLVTIIICTTLIFCALTQRFDIEMAQGQEEFLKSKLQKPVCYKIDKLTGKVWLIKQSKQYQVHPYEYYKKRKKKK